MSNGARASSAASVGRAIAFSPSRGAVNAEADTEIMGLLMDEPLAAAQLSHSQIIERQAETIAQLERQVARGKEYKTLTKVKLKEAAQRLKDYRERVERLMVEVETAKQEIKKLETEKKKAMTQAQTAKNQLAAADAKAAKAILAAEEKARALLKRSAPTRTIAVQTDAVPATDIPTRKDGVGTTSSNKRTRTEALLPVEATEGKKPKVASSKIDQLKVQGAPSKAMDAIAAAIDAELELCDDDDDDDGDGGEKKTNTPTTSTSTPEVGGLIEFSSSAIRRDDAISKAIDDELDFSSSSGSSSSSSSDNSSSDEEEEADCKSSTTGVVPTTVSVDVDAMSAAIDAELVSSSDEEGDEQTAVPEKDTTVNDRDLSEVPAAINKGDGPGATGANESRGFVVATAGDAVAAAIDAELMSPDEDEACDGLDRGEDLMTEVAEAENSPSPTQKLMEETGVVDTVSTRTCLVAESPARLVPSTTLPPSPTAPRPLSAATSVPRPAGGDKRTDPTRLPPVNQAQPQPKAPTKVFVLLKAALVEHIEQVDAPYVARTLGALIKQVSFLLKAAGASRSHPLQSPLETIMGVTNLCQMVVDEYRYRKVDGDLLRDGIVRVYRTPRSRHQVDWSVIVLAQLFRIVLFRFHRIAVDRADDHHQSLPPEEKSVDVLRDLQKLRDLAVMGGLNNPVGFDDVPKTASSAVTAMVAAAGVSSHMPPVSHDKALLAHVCALHVELCKRVGRTDISRALLLDVLKHHANIKGLYCIRGMVRIDSRLLRKEWDSRGNEVLSAARQTIVEELISISSTSAAKQELILDETATIMLTRIAEAIDEPHIADIPPRDPSSFAKLFWRDYVEPCILLKTTAHQVDDVAIALELLATIHRDAYMTRHFPLDLFKAKWMDCRIDQEDGMVEMDTADVEPAQLRRQRQVILKLVGAIGRGVLRSKAAASGSLIADIFQWFRQVWGYTFEDQPLFSTVIGVVVDLMVGVSPAVRGEWLPGLLCALPRERLECLLPPTLRQLRMLVGAGRSVAS